MCRYTHQRRKTPEKGSTFRTGIHGVMYHDIKGYETTLKSVAPHIKLLETIERQQGLKIVGKRTSGVHVLWKNTGLGRRIRIRICDGSPHVGKGPISPDEAHKIKTNEENIDESQGQSNRTLYIGRCDTVWVLDRFIHQRMFYVQIRRLRQI